MKVTILSRGACPRQSIELIGLSTKRDDPDQVGQFGSGSAFAMVLAVREGMPLRISSQDGDGAFVMSPWANSQGRIYWRFRQGSPLIKNWWDTVGQAMGRAQSRPTSFTKGFGELDWEGQWPVLREFITNARDADPQGFAVYVGGEPPVEAFLEDARREGYSGVTVVEIDNVDLDISGRWDEFFRFERPGSIPGGNWSDIYRESPLISIMSGIPGDRAGLFVKGVRVDHGVPGKSMFSWSLGMDITEARTLKRDFDFSWHAARLLNQACQKTPSLALEVLEWVSENPDSFEAQLPMDYHTTTLNKENVWLNSLDGRTVAAAHDKVKAPAALVVPSAWKAGLEKVGVQVARRPLEGGNGPVVFTEPEKPSAPKPKDVLFALVSNAVSDLLSEKGLISLDEWNHRREEVTSDDLAALCADVGFDWSDWASQQGLEEEGGL